MRKYLPYVLPSITMVIILVLLLKNPSVTGLTVFQNTEIIERDVQITTSPNVVIPEQSVIEVTLDGKSSSLGFKEFVELSKIPYVIAQGENPSLKYRGEGFKGSYTYAVPLSEFGLGEVQKGIEHILTIKLSYQGKVFLESTQNIR